jgi:translation initiation factor IF-2
VEIPASLSVKQLADTLKVSPIEVIKELMKKGIMANINQSLDRDIALSIARELGFEPLEAKPSDEEAAEQISRPVLEEDAALQQPRPPVVTIMGHVDHGKTSLLDAIRNTNVVASEVGGITQHIGAYQVEVHNQKITFLDTPGHEAFTAMRARGAQVTDIAVLVVAADDGVMPQTKEAIDHARAAGVPIVVAINKIDKPNANPDRVKQQLADLGLVIEEWGGDVVCVPVSAKKMEGIQELLENILVVAEVQELKANPNREAVGVVVEAEMDKSRGPLATVLIQTGTLKVGDTVVVGETWGRVKAMFNELGKRVKRAEPSTPVAILGLGSVPQAGDPLQAVPNEKTAKEIVQERQSERQRKTAGPVRALSLDDLSQQIQDGSIRELAVILKTDVQGSLEPIISSLQRLEHDSARVKVIHAHTGSVTESDVLLALASRAIILGFNTRIEPGARRLAEAEGVDIRQYDVIYKLTEDIEKALTGLLEPQEVEVVEGHAEVRQVFRIGKRGAVAGSFVRDGKVRRGASVRIIREGTQVHESSVSSLRRLKDDVREVAAGFECGIGVEGFTDFQEGDILEFFRKGKAPSPQPSSGPGSA